MTVFLVGAVLVAGAIAVLTAPKRDEYCPRCKGAELLSKNHAVKHLLEGE